MHLKEEELRLRGKIQALEAERDALLTRIDVLESNADETLLSAIRSALDRHSRNREREDRMVSIRKRLDALSSRERDVLKGLAAGKANKVIAYDLGISARTVEVYRANVMTKMQADSLSELVRMVLMTDGES